MKLALKISLLAILNIIIINSSFSYFPGNTSYISNNCPKDKPFTGRWHEKCVGCDTKTPLFTEDGQEQIFDICPNRVTIGGYSYLKTGEKLEVWSGDHGEYKWKPCTDTYPYTSAPYYGKTYETDQMSDMQVSKAICKACAPYRKYADGFCHVVKSPIAEKPLIDIKPISWDKDNNPTHYLYNLYPCDTTRPVLFAMQEDCEKCPNREYKDGLCIIKGNDKDTPLRMAALTASNPEIIKKLVANGADINATDIVGNTILMYAAHNQNKAIVEILIELGADVYAKNINDETALIFSGWASSPCNMILEQYHMNNKNLPPPAQPADAGTNKKKYLDVMP